MSNQANDNDKKPSRFNWSWIFTLLLAGILLFFAFRGVNWREMFVTVREGQWEYLALALVFLTLAILWRALRWRVLLSATRQVPPLPIFWATYVGYLGNYFLPARLGELIRSVLMGQVANISKSYVLATAFTERIMDAIALVLFGLISLPLVSQIPDWMVSAVQGVTLIGVVGVIILFVTPRFESLIVTVLLWVPLPARFSETLVTLATQFLMGMQAFQQGRRAIAFALLTALAWLFDALAFTQIANAFNLTLSLPEALLLLAALGLSSAAPSTPGYIGIYQFVAVTVLVPLGFAQNDALVLVLAFQAVDYLGVTALGAIGLWRLGIAKSGLSLRQSLEEADSTPPDA